MFSLETQTKNKYFQEKNTFEKCAQSRLNNTSQLSKKKRDEFFRQKRKRIVDSRDVKKDFDIKNILLWIQSIKNLESEEHVSRSVEFLRLSFAFDNEKPVQLSLQHEIIPNIVSFLNTNNSKLIVSSVWVLTNLAAMSHEATNIMVENGVVHFLVSFLNNENNSIIEQVLWALCNISGDSSNSRDIILQANITPIIVNIVKNSTNIVNIVKNSTNMEILVLISWLIMNLCRDNSDWKSLSPLLDCIRRLIYFEDSEILCNTCSALNFMSNDANSDINDIIKSGTCKKLVELLEHPEVRIKLPALRTIGNILTGDDNQVQVLINLNVINGLSSLLDNSSSIIKEVCWVISNITASSLDHIKVIIEHEIILKIIKISKTYEREARKEALMVIINAITCSLSSEVIEFFISKGVMEAIAQVFDWKDYTIISYALDVIDSILKVGESCDNNSTILNELECSGIIHSVQSLMMDKNEEVSKRAEFLNGKYFNKGDVMEFN